MTRLLKIIFSFVLIVRVASAQEAYYTFTNLNDKNGLSDNIIFSFLKGRNEILWIGTQNGLCRFDGTHFYTFKRKREGNSIPNNSIECLCEDKAGNVWGGTDNGLFCYHPEQHRFETFFAPKDCYDNVITNILCDSKGDIYASTNTAIIRFNTKPRSFQTILQLAESKEVVNYFTIRKNCLLLDEKTNGFWMAVNTGLFYYNLGNKKLLNFKSLSDNPLFTRRSVSALAVSPKGHFWFCDNSAKTLVAFDPVSKKIIRTVDLNKTAPNTIGAKLIEDRHNRLWLSSWSNECLLIDLAKQPAAVQRINSKEGNNYTIAANFFWAAFEDENGSIWLGTINGISICNPDISVYKACRLPDKIPGLDSSVIRIIEEDPNDNTWWLTTNHGQIIHYFPATGLHKVYLLNDVVANRNGLRPTGLLAIRFINRRIVITSGEGAWQLLPGASRFVPLDMLPETYADFVVMYFVSAEPMVYMSDGNKILSLNTTTKEVAEIPTFDSSSNEQHAIGIFHLLCKKDRPLYWIAYKNDIGFLRNGKPHQMKVIKNDSLESGGFFRSVDLDKEGNLWIGHKGVGLYRYAPGSEQVRYWTELDGLGSNHLHHLKCDDSGNVWTMYFNKVSVFRPARQTFINFNIPYSENNITYPNYIIKRKDGILMGSVGNDLFEFSPANLIRVPKRKTPEFSSIAVSGRDFFNTLGEHVVLRPDENSIRFTFGLLVDPVAFPHYFDYFLEGSDHHWVRSSSGNEVTYNNLPPGKYTFRLIAKGQNNNWRSSEKTFSFTISTPFYKTTWFIVLVITAITFGLFLFYRFRLAQKEHLILLENKTQHLEKEKTLMMYDSLKQQLNPHFLFNSLTSLSGLIETDQQMAGEFLEQMSGIYRYILKSGESEVVSLSNELEFAQLYIKLQLTRFTKGLKVEIQVPQEYLMCKIAPVTIQNLIENAIKHNMIDQESPLHIRISIEGDYILVQNNLQRKNKVETSNNKGLSQIISFYKFLSDKPVLIEEAATLFTVKIPLI